MTHEEDGKTRSVDSHPSPDALAYTLRDARRLGGPSRSQAYKLESRGQLKFVRVGRRTLVEGNSLRRLLSEGER